MSSVRILRSLPLPHALVCLALALPLAALLSSPLAAQIDCLKDSKYRALDFMIGDWEVSTDDGKRLGESRIQARQQGCLIAESWRGETGDTAETVTYVDPTTGRWHQLSLSSQGGVLKLEGELVSAGRLELTGELSSGDGVTPVRGVVTRAAGGIAETLEVSRDGGASYSPLLEVRYRPLDAPRVTQKSAPATVAAKEPAAAGRPPEVPVAATPDRTPSEPRVESLSRRVDRDDAMIDVEAPMVLEVELGPVEKTRPGYGWTSTETDRYRSEGAIVSKIQASRRDKGGSTFVEVTVSLRSERRSERYTVEVALLEPKPGGSSEVVVSDSQRVPAGQGLQSQIQYGAVERTFSLELKSERFEQLFRDGQARPLLRLTLTGP